MWIKVKENIWKWTDISSCLNERETPVIKDKINAPSIISYREDKIGSKNHFS